MDLLSALSVFVRVAETASFSAVARERGVTQPAISRQIAALEEHLGARLVHRTTRSVALTEEGRDFLGPAQSVLQQLEEAETAVGSRQGGISGLVRISCQPVFGRVVIAPRIHLLLQRHAKLSIDLVHEEPTLDLVHDAVDLAIHVGELPIDRSYIVRKVGLFAPVIVGAPSYLDASPPLRNPADLSDHDCIIDDNAANRDVWTLEGPAGTVDIPVAGRLRTDNSDAKREAVLNGVGLAAVSKWLVRHDLRDGVLQVVLPEWRFPAVPVHVIYPSKRNLAPRVRVVLDFLLELLTLDPEFSGLFSA
ncbi:MAG: LysR family transcriptional regulator [Acetobacteraceae bacterium]|nr:LysR family transcriptional regulator [Acetobacteraceae bacterium]